MGLEEPAEEKMDRARPGRRRASSEIVTEGKRKKSSPADLQKVSDNKVVNCKVRGCSCSVTIVQTQRLRMLVDKKPKK